jgi:hypothetical protein
VKGKKRDKQRHVRASKQHTEQACNRAGQTSNRSACQQQEQPCTPQPFYKGGRGEAGRAGRGGEGHLIPPKWMVIQIFYQRGSFTPLWCAGLQKGSLSIAFHIISLTNKGLAAGRHDFGWGALVWLCMYFKLLILSNYSCYLQHARVPRAACGTLVGLTQPAAACC